MPILIALAGGAALMYLLADSELTIPAFIALCVFIFFLYTSPALAGYFFLFICVAALVFAVIAFWEQALGIILGVVMFMLLVGGLLHAIDVAHGDEYMNEPCDQVEECE